MGNSAQLIVKNERKKSITAWLQDCLVAPTACQIATHFSLTKSTAVAYLYEMERDWASATSWALVHGFVPADLVPLGAAPVAAEPAAEAPDLAKLLEGVIDNIANNWPMRKYSLEEIEIRLRAIVAEAGKDGAA